MAAATADDELYELALQLAERIDLLVEQAERTRFHVKELLDKSATGLVLQVGRARTETGPERAAAFRAARRLAIDVVTLLDVLLRRHSAFADQLGPARVIAGSLADQLTALAPPSAPAT